MLIYIWHTLKPVMFILIPYIRNTPSCGADTLMTFLYLVRWHIHITRVCQLSFARYQSWSPQYLPSAHAKNSRDIHHHWCLLTQCYPTIPELRYPPLICSKHPANLRDTLIRADIGSKKQSTQSTLHPARTGTFPCLHCSNVIKGDHTTHPQTGKRFSIRGIYLRHILCSLPIEMTLWPCVCWQDKSTNERPLIQPQVDDQIWENMVASPGPFH